MFLGNPIDLHLPALISKNFSIDFSAAYHEQHVVLQLAMAMNPGLEGENLAYVKVLSDDDTRALYFIVREHGRKDFKGQVRTLRKILEYRKLSLVDYRIICPAWDDDAALSLDRLQSAARELHKLGGCNATIPLETIAQFSTTTHMWRELGIITERMLSNYRHIEDPERLYRIPVDVKASNDRHAVVEAATVPDYIHRPRLTALRLILRTFRERVREAFTFPRMRTS